MAIKFTRSQLWSRVCQLKSGVGLLLRTTPLYISCFLVSPQFALPHGFDSKKNCQTAYKKPLFWQVRISVPKMDKRPDGGFGMKISKSPFPFVAIKWRAALCLCCFFMRAICQKNSGALLPVPQVRCRKKSKTATKRRMLNKSTRRFALP